VDQYNNLIDNIENKLRGMTGRKRRKSPPMQSRTPKIPSSASKKSYSEYLNPKAIDPPIHQHQHKLMPQRRHPPIRSSGRSYLSEKIRDTSNDLSGSLDRIQNLGAGSRQFSRKHRPPIVNSGFERESFDRVESQFNNTSSHQ
jgi:hypothetical protein